MLHLMKYPESTRIVFLIISVSDIGCLAKEVNSIDFQRAVYLFMPPSNYIN